MVTLNERAVTTVQIRAPSLCSFNAQPKGFTCIRRYPVEYIGLIEREGGKSLADFLNTAIKDGLKNLLSDSSICISSPCCGSPLNPKAR